MHAHTQKYLDKHARTQTGLNKINVFVQLFPNVGIVTGNWANGDSFVSLEVTTFKVSVIREE